MTVKTVGPRNGVLDETGEVYIARELSEEVIPHILMRPMILLDCCGGFWTGYFCDGPEGTWWRSGSGQVTLDMRVWTHFVLYDELPLVPNHELAVDSCTQPEYGEVCASIRRIVRARQGFARGYFADGRFVFDEAGAVFLHSCTLSYSRLTEGRDIVLVDETGTVLFARSLETDQTTEEQWWLLEDGEVVESLKLGLKGSLWCSRLDDITIENGAPLHPRFKVRVPDTVARAMRDSPVLWERYRTWRGFC